MLIEFHSPLSFQEAKAKEKSHIHYTIFIKYQEKSGNIKRT